MMEDEEFFWRYYWLSGILLVAGAIRELPLLLPEFVVGNFSDP